VKSHVCWLGYKPQHGQNACVRDIVRCNIKNGLPSSPEVFKHPASVQSIQTLPEMFKHPAS